MHQIIVDLIKSIKNAKQSVLTTETVLPRVKVKNLK